MSTFLIRSATSLSSSYPIVLTRLGGPRSTSNPHLKFVEVPGIEPATSWSVVGHANHYTKGIIVTKISHDAKLAPIPCIDWKLISNWDRASDASHNAIAQRSMTYSAWPWCWERVTLCIGIITWRKEHNLKNIWVQDPRLYAIEVRWAYTRNRRFRINVFKIYLGKPIGPRV